MDQQYSKSKQNQMQAQVHSQSLNEQQSVPQNSSTIYQLKKPNAPILQNSTNLSQRQRLVIQQTSYFASLPSKSQRSTPRKSKKKANQPNQQYTYPGPKNLILVKNPTSKTRSQQKIQFQKMQEQNPSSTSLLNRALQSYEKQQYISPYAPIPQIRTLTQKQIEQKRDKLFKRNVTNWDGLVKIQKTKQNRQMKMLFK